MAKDHLGEVEVSNGAAIGGALVLFSATRLYQQARRKTIIILIISFFLGSAVALSR